MHFGWKTGYGYDDAGREAVGSVFADVFHTDAALVRTTFVNGTHALAPVLLGILRPGDELIYATGDPYDTLQTVSVLRITRRETVPSRIMELPSRKLTFFRTVPSILKV